MASTLQWFRKEQKSEEFIRHCMQNKIRCPLLALEFIWQELFVNFSSCYCLSSITTLYILLTLLLSSLIYMVPKIISDRGDDLNNSDDKKAQLRTLIELLKYNIDKGHAIYLENVYVRLSKATYEISCMRKKLLKLLKLDISQDAYKFFDLREYFVESSKLRKLKRAEISTSTTGHIEKICQCYSCINLIANAKRQPIAWHNRIINSVLQRAHRIIFGESEEDRDVQLIKDSIAELDKYIKRALALVYDEHSGLLNNTPDNIIENMQTVLGRNVIISLKLNVVLHSICDWLNLLKVQYIEQRRYNQIEFCRPLWPKIKALERRLAAEKKALFIMKKAIADKEHRSGYVVRKHVKVHETIEKFYNKAIHSLLGEPFKGILNNPDLLDMPCKRKAVRKAKSTMIQSIGEDTELTHENRQTAVIEHFNDIKCHLENMRQEGVLKALELKTIGSSVENLAERDPGISDQIDETEVASTSCSDVLPSPNEVLDKYLSAHNLQEAMMPSKKFIGPLTNSEICAEEDVDVPTELFDQTFDAHFTTEDLAYLAPTKDFKLATDTNLKEQIVGMVQTTAIQVNNKNHFEDEKAKVINETARRIQESVAEYIEHPPPKLIKKPGTKVPKEFDPLQAIQEESDSNLPESGSNESLYSQRSQNSIILQISGIQRLGKSQSQQTQEITGSNDDMSADSKLVVFDKSVQSFKSIEDESEPEGLEGTTSEESLPTPRPEVSIITAAELRRIQALTRRK